MINRRGRIELIGNVPLSFLTYYRFKIYNSSENNSGQFDKLKELASQFTNDLVCYSAPCFHLESEYHRFFRQRQILNNSILIPIHQFLEDGFNPPFFDINDGEEHTLSYRSDENFGFLCSDAKKIVVLNSYSSPKPKKSEYDFKETVNHLIEKFVLRDLDSEIQSEFEELKMQQKVQYIFMHLLVNYNILWFPRTNIE